MAVGSLDLRVSKEDFENRISTIDQKMGVLTDVINRYNNAKENLDQFIESNDSNYEKMVERIDVNISAARKSYAALQRTKVSLEETVSQMENFNTEVSETIGAATEAAREAINAALKIEEIL